MNDCTGSVVDSVHNWMGSIFFRGIDPSHMGYADLRYYHRWHDLIGETELSEAQKLRAQLAGK